VAVSVEGPLLSSPEGVNVLTRMARSALSPSPSSLQTQVDGLVSRFVEEAANPNTLAALMAGGMAYRFGRVGILAMGEGRVAAGSLLQSASIVGGFGLEVGTYELTSRTLSRDSNPNRWNWSGPGGWAQGLTTSAITFGMLKGAGFLGREQNLIFQHAFQGTAMVAGHNTAGILGLAPRPEGSLAEQFLHAEATNLQLGAGMALVHSMAPGVSALERSLDLSIRTRDRAPTFSPGRFLSQLAMASERAAGRDFGEEASLRPEIDPNVLMASSNEGGDGPEKPEEGQAKGVLRGEMIERKVPGAVAGRGKSSTQLVTDLLEINLRAFIDVLPHGAGFFKVNHDRSLGSMLMVNDQLPKMFGYTSFADISDKPLLDFVHPDWVNKIGDWLSRVPANGRPFNFEEILLKKNDGTKDGTFIWCKVTGGILDIGNRPVGFINVEDITKQKQSLEALRSSEVRNEALLKAIPDSMFRMRRDGTLLDVRADWVTPLLGGRSPIGSNVKDWTLPSDLIEKGLAAVARAIDTGDDTFDHEMPMPDGSMRIHEARVVRSGPDEIVSIVRDVSDLRKAQEARIAQERFDMVRKFGRFLAHDTNNVATKLLPSLQMIRRLLEKSKTLEDLEKNRESIERYLDRAERQARRYTTLARDFRDLSSDPEKGAPFDLHLILLEERELRDFVGEEVNLQIQRENQEPIYISGSWKNIKRVLENLMQNALDAMQGQEEKKLTLRTSTLSLSEADISRMVPSIYSFIVKPGKYVCIEVEDSGQGIKEEDLPHIFELNFSTKSKDESARGLGLALSLKFVQDNLGFINVESEPGKGTKFKVYLPLAPEPFTP